MFRKSTQELPKWSDLVAEDVVEVDEVNSGTKRVEPSDAFQHGIAREIGPERKIRAARPETIRPRGGRGIELGGRLGQRTLPTSALIRDDSWSC